MHGFITCLRHWGLSLLSILLCPSLSGPPLLKILCFLISPPVHRLTRWSFAWASEPSVWAKEVGWIEFLCTSSIVANKVVVIRDNDTSHHSVELSSVKLATMLFFSNDFKISEKFPPPPRFFLCGPNSMNTCKLVNKFGGSFTNSVFIHWFWPLIKWSLCDWEWILAHGQLSQGGKLLQEKGFNCLFTCK